MVLEVLLQQAQPLKKVVGAMKDLRKCVGLNCSEKAIQFLAFRESAFSKFKRDQLASLGMRFDSFASVFNPVVRGGTANPM